MLARFVTESPCRLSFLAVLRHGLILRIAEPGLPTSIFIGEDPPLDGLSLVAGSVLTPATQTFSAWINPNVVVPERERGQARSGKPFAWTRSDVVPETTSTSFPDPLLL